MKKILSASLAFILCVTMVFTFSGCMLRNPVKKLSKLIEKQNYKMEIEALWIKFETKVDGDITYTDGIASETYTVDNGDTITVYTKTDDGWTVEEKDDENDNYDYTDLFDSDAWDKVDKSEYELVDEDLMKEFEFEEAVLKIEDDEYELEIENKDGMELTVTFSDFGKIDLELPDVD